MAQYADVIELAAPAETLPGSQVNITVKIKNLYSATISIMVSGALEYGVTPWPNVTFPGDWANVGAGETCEFSGYFIMPDQRVTVHAYSFWYGADGLWYFDDEMTKVVNVAALTPLASDFRIADFNKV